MNRLSFRVALLLCAAGLTCMEGCAPVSLGTPGGPARGVYQAQSDFAAVLDAAQAYENLPYCHPGDGTPLCSDRDMDSKITAAAKAASAALMTVQDAVRGGSPISVINAELADAQNDLATFGALVASVKK